MTLQCQQTFGLDSDDLAACPIMTNDLLNHIANCARLANDLPMVSYTVLTMLMHAATYAVQGQL